MSPGWGKRVKIQYVQRFLNFKSRPVHRFVIIFESTEWEGKVCVKKQIILNVLWIYFFRCINLFVAWLRIMGRGMRTTPGLKSVTPGTSCVTIPIRLHSVSLFWIWLWKWTTGLGFSHSLKETTTKNNSSNAPIRFEKVLHLKIGAGRTVEMLSADGK